MSLILTFAHEVAPAGPSSTYRKRPEEKAKIATTLYASFSSVTGCFAPAPALQYNVLLTR